MAACCRWLAALLICISVAVPSLSACPFCASAGQTLTQDASQAMFIVFGKLANPKFDPNASLQGTTDLNIEIVIKPHSFLKDKKTITLNRYIPVTKDDTSKYLVFCDVYNGKLDAYRGVQLKAGSKIADYLKGALAVKDKDATARLAYFFKYLDCDEYDLSNDAFGEFANAPYSDYRDLAKKLSPDLLVKWLKDESTSPARFGLYGSMLGHCGKPEHAKVLRELLDDPNKRYGTGMDGLLAGYVMITPKDGWKYVSEIFKDSSKDFMLRYAALRTARFLWDFRPDLVAKKNIVATVVPMMTQEDIADLAIEDLRKWQRWEMLAKVLALFDDKSLDKPIIKRLDPSLCLELPAEGIPQGGRVCRRPAQARFRVGQGRRGTAPARTRHEAEGHSIDCGNGPQGECEKPEVTRGLLRGLRMTNLLDQGWSHEADSRSAGCRLVCRLPCLCLLHLRRRFSQSPDDSPGRAIGPGGGVRQAGERQARSRSAGRHRLHRFENRTGFERH